MKSSATISTTKKSDLATFSSRAHNYHSIDATREMTCTGYDLVLQGRQT